MSSVMGSMNHLQYHIEIKLERTLEIDATRLISVPVWWRDHCKRGHSHTGANDADLIALETTQKRE
jgi:hypothetical protein